MDSSSVSKELVDKLTPIEVREGAYGRTGVHLDLSIEPEKIRQAAELLLTAGCFLEDLTAVDHASHREMVYHFNEYSQPFRIVIRANLGPEDEIESIQDLCPAADWQERECFEMLGVKFSGHSDLRRLLLPEDADFFPLRKDFVNPPEAQAPEYHQETDDH